jgi:hypothetical protein
MVVAMGKSPGSQKSGFEQKRSIVTQISQGCQGLASQKTGRPVGREVHVTELK